VLRPQQQQLVDDLRGRGELAPALRAAAEVPEGAGPFVARRHVGGEFR